MVAKYKSLTVILFTLVLVACGSERKNDNVLVGIMNTQKTSSEPAKVISSDSYVTSDGNLNVTLVGHASLIFEYQGKIIHVDPYSNVANYSDLPKADLIILTHEHSDHLDTAAINKI